MSISTYQGDCLEVMQQIPDGSVDLITEQLSDGKWKAYGSAY